MEKTKEKMNEKNVQKLFYKTNPRGGISLIVLVITIIIIIILAAAVVVSIVNNNPMSEANDARIKSDVSNMQSIFTNAVGKVMAENQDVVTIDAGALNTVTSGDKSAVGNAVYKFADGTSGEIIFDTLEKDGLKYYTGRRLPLYKQKTTWYVDEDGIISLEVGNKKYGDGKIIKNIKIVTEVIPSEEYIKKSATVRIEVSGEDEIESIKFGGNDIPVPERKDEKYVVEVEVTENGEYEIEATGKGGGKNTAKVEVNVIDVVNEEIKINSTVTLKDEFIKTVANIGLEIEYSGEIDSIKINGESVVVPSKTGGKYIVNKEVTKNGEYKVEVRAKDGTVNSKVVKVEIIETLNANIRIDATVSPKSDYTSADIVLVVSYSGEITSIKIEGESQTVPSKVNGKYNVSKNVLQNGEYKVEVIVKDGTKNKMRVKVTQITEDMEIWNRSDMEKFRNMVNSGRTFEGRKATVMADMNLGGSSSNKWVPIGYNGVDVSAKPFKGTFDGGNYSISGVSINSSENYVGFFAYLSEDSKVDNVKLENVNITGVNNVGGLVGYNASNNNIDNCSVSGTVNGNSSVGGIIGLSEKTTPKIINCSSTTKITGNTYVGGIVGYNQSKIEKCGNYGNVVANVTSAEISLVGGIVGDLNKGYIFSCVNKGNISGKTYVGGIVGDIRSGTYVDYCYSTGTITASGQTSTGITACGGIAAEAYGNIRHSFATGVVSGKANYVGGVLGFATSSVTAEYVMRFSRCI